MGSNDGGMTLDDFLGDTGRKGSFLTGWKKGGSVVVFLHPRARIYKRYQHQFHYVEAVEDKETRKVRRVVRFMRFGCWEGEVVWGTRRDRDTGLLEVEPKLCSMDRLKEALIRLPEKKLAGDAVVFRMRGVNFDDEEVVVKYTKGFLTGEFKPTKTSWKQTLDLKQSWLLSAIPATKPEGGCKIMEETDSVGQALRRAIKERIDSKGDEDGNPFVRPVAWKLSYDEDASPKDKYTVHSQEKVPVTDEVKAQFAADPPDLSPYVKRGDATLLKTYMLTYATDEAKAVIDFDVIFAPSIAAGEKERGGEDAEPRRQQRREAVEDEPERKAAPAEASGGRRRKKAEPEPEPMGDPCDECGYVMKKGQLKCGGCGTEYEDDPPTPKGDGVKPEGGGKVKSETVADDDPFDDSLPF